MRVTVPITMALAGGLGACVCPGCDGQGGEEVGCSEESPDSCGEETPHCLVSESRCVECLEVAHCPEGARCVDHECLPPLAPGFSLPDMNPRSASFGETVTLGDHLGEVVLIFFAALG